MVAADQAAIIHQEAANLVETTEPRAADSTSSLEEVATDLVRSVLSKLETKQDACPLPDQDQGQGPDTKDDTASTDDDKASTMIPWGCDEAAYRPIQAVLHGQT